MGMGFAPTWLRQVSPPPLHKTTFTTAWAVNIYVDQSVGKDLARGECRMLFSVRGGSLKLHPVVKL